MITHKFGPPVHVDIDDRDCLGCGEGTCTDHCVYCGASTENGRVLGDDAWWCGPRGRTYCSDGCLELEAERRADLDDTRWQARQAATR